MSLVDSMGNVKNDDASSININKNINNKNDFTTKPQNLNNNYINNEDQKISLAESAQQKSNNSNNIQD